MFKRHASRFVFRSQFLPAVEDASLVLTLPIHGKPIPTSTHGPGVRILLNRAPLPNLRVKLAAPSF